MRWGPLIRRTCRLPRTRELAGLREAEGVHLVLRRESEAGRTRGRRRRAAVDGTAGPPAPGPVPGPGRPEEVADRAPESGPAAPGRHTVPSRPALQAPTALAAPVQVVAPAVPTASAPVASSSRAPGQLSVFGLCGEDPVELADRLEVIAAGAGEMGDAELRELARQLACGVLAGRSTARVRSGPR